MYYVKGAVERVLNECKSKYENGQVVPLLSNHQKQIIAHASELGSSGLRGSLFAIFITASIIYITRMCGESFICARSL